MNLDLASVFNFGDAQALRQFMLDHVTVHNQTSRALSLKYGGVFTTFGLLDELAEDGWIEAMAGRKVKTDSLEAWLEIHAQIHNQTYQQINGVGSTAPDLSLVDFSNQEQFYTWMFVHQEIHDYEQATLKLI